MRYRLLSCCAMGMLWCAALCASNAQAQALPVHLEDMTWQEVRERQARGTFAIVVPTGGTEQNGPHLAIGKHNRIVAFTAAEIAQELGFALVAPVVSYVPEGRIHPPEGHMRFPGTISMREETFAALLEDTARSFKQGGFRLICFIGDSGGNQRMQQYVADKLSAEWRNEGVKVLNVTDYYAGNGQKEWLAANGIGGETPEAHAGFMDTAELLAIDPSLVRTQLVETYSQKDYLATGASGDARGAAAQQGRTLLAKKV